MRKILFSTILFLISTSSFSQQITPERQVTQQDYLKKSKKQKKVATILLASGSVFIITSLVIPRGELVYDGFCIGISCSDKYKNSGIKNAFAIAGSLSAISSIPFSIISRKNRKNAASVSFKLENTIHQNDQKLVYTSFPALRIKVSF